MNDRGEPAMIYWVTFLEKIEAATPEEAALKLVEYMRDGKNLRVRGADENLEPLALVTVTGAGGKILRVVRQN